VRYILCSDVHGNLEALQALLEAVEGEKADRFVFLGDLVGYGADPNACVEKLREVAHLVLAGNHDYGALGLTDIDYFNPHARAAIFWTRKTLSPENHIYLKTLPLKRVENGLTLVHSSPFRPEDWYYISGPEEAIEGFSWCETPLCFVGHTHFPILFIMEPSGRVRYGRFRKVHLEEGLRYLINVGSVGQPRDGNPDSCYVLYDGNEGLLELKRVPYDVETAQEKILAAGLPSFLAYRLAQGM